jgi:hypothetical protein
MNMKYSANKIGGLLRLIDLFLITYFATVNFPVVFPGLEKQLNMAVELLRPFVSVFIPVYNIGYTFFSIIILVIFLIMAAFKNLDMDKNAVARVANMKSINRGIIISIFSLVENCTLVWLAWSYGAHYMAFIVFVMLIVSRLCIRAVNNAIEHSKNRAVQIISEQET